MEKMAFRWRESKKVDEKEENNLKECKTIAVCQDKIALARESKYQMNTRVRY